MEMIPLLIGILTRFLNIVDDLSFTIAFFVIAYLIFRHATKEIREKSEPVEKVLVVFIARKHFTDTQFFLYRLSFVIFGWPLYKLALFLLLSFLHTLVPESSPIND